jgi:hypothetical protein
MFHNYPNIKEIVVKCIIILPLSTRMRRLFSFITMVKSQYKYLSGEMFETRSIWSTSTITL